MEALAYAHETDGDLNTFCFLDATFASRQDGKVIIVSTEKISSFLNGGLKIQVKYL